MTPDMPGANPLNPEALKGLMQMGAELDRALMSLAQAAPDAAKEFSQARQLIQAGFAKIATKAPSPVSTSPTAAGAQFTGGGFNSTGGL